MKQFKWKGENLKNIPQEGILKAPSASLAQHLLTQNGITRITLTEFRARKKMNVSEKSRRDFFYECKELITAGIPLYETLITLSKHYQTKSLGSILQEMASNIESGKSLSESCKQFPHFFTDIDIKLIHTAEQTGTLDTVLSHLAKYHEQKHLLLQQIKKALAYPCFLFITSLAVMFLLLTFVIPRFENLFIGQGQSLPFLTREVIAFSHHMTSFACTTILCLIAFGCIYFACYRRSPSLHCLQERFLWRTPILGRLLKNIALTRMLYVLALTLQSGLSLLDALTHAHALTPSYQIKLSLIEIQKCASNGQSLARAFVLHPIFPPKLCQYIALAENTGNIERMLEYSAHHYQNETEHTMGLLKEFAEPFIIGVLGVMIGIIVIAMYLPVFTLGKII